MERWCSWMVSQRFQPHAWTHSPLQKRFGSLHQWKREFQCHVGAHGERSYHKVQESTKPIQRHCLLEQGTGKFKQRWPTLPTHRPLQDPSMGWNQTQNLCLQIGHGPKLQSWREIPWGFSLIYMPLMKPSQAKQQGRKQLVKKRSWLGQSYFWVCLLVSSWLKFAICNILRHKG